ncbi:arylsulfotransferase family protein [Verrucomicrobiales bacterium]|nr:arylsulfotransferase family protein [Verrucomicrobiales bacterium]
MNRFILTALLCLPYLANAAPPERLVIGAEGKKGVAIVDPADNNKVLWHHPIGAVHDLHLLPGNRILTQDGWAKIIEVNLKKKVVWEYDATKINRGENDGKVEIHAYQRLKGGSTMIVESGPGRIIEVTPEKEIIKELPLQVSSPSPHSDTRLVRQLENGNYLVAHENDQMVKEYNPEGKVIWEFPVPLFGKDPAKGHGPEAFGGKCFAAVKAKNGNYLIATGNGHSIIEVTPEKEVVWKLGQNELDGIALAWVTTIEELKNGNLRIGNCHAGPDNPQIIEITREKKVVWTFHDFQTFGNALANTLVIDGKRAERLRTALAKLGSEASQ